MCPDSLSEIEFNDMWKRVANIIDVRGMKKKEMKHSLNNKYLLVKGVPVKDERPQTLVKKGFVDAFYEKAKDSPDGEIARDLWGLRNIEKWKDGKERFVWRNEKGHFTRNTEIIESRTKPSRTTPARRVSREKPARR